jgi:hypothetical protein
MVRRLEKKTNEYVSLYKKNKRKLANQIRGATVVYGTYPPPNASSIEQSGVINKMLMLYS